MNITTKTEEPSTQEQSKQTPRSNVTARIREAQMPQVTKKFANRLLAENHNVGGTFNLSMANLRKLRFAATNLDVVKSLAKLRRVGLLTYAINQQTQVVEMRFVVK